MVASEEGWMMGWERQMEAGWATAMGMVAKGGSVEVGTLLQQTILVNPCATFGNIEVLSKVKHLQACK